MHSLLSEDGLSGLNAEYSKPNMAAGSTNSPVWYTPAHTLPWLSLVRDWILHLRVSYRMLESGMSTRRSLPSSMNLKPSDTVPSIITSSLSVWGTGPFSMERTWIPVIAASWTRLILFSEASYTHIPSVSVLMKRSPLLSSSSKAVIAASCFISSIPGTLSGLSEPRSYMSSPLIADAIHSRFLLSLNMSSM